MPPAAAMRAAGVAGLGSFVLAGKEKLCLIRAKGDALVLERLFVAEQVYGQAEIDEAAREPKVKKAELDLAREQLGRPRALERRDEPVECKPQPMLTPTLRA